MRLPGFISFETDDLGGAYEAFSAESQAPEQQEMPDGWADDQAPASEAPGAFDYDDPRFQQAVEQAAQRQLDAVLQQAAQYDEQQQVEQGETEYVDPEVLQVIDQRFQRMLDQRMEQIAPTVEAFEDQQNIQQIEQWTQAEPAIQEAQQMLGEGDDVPSAANLVQFAATGYIGDLEARYGPGERATRTALRMAADQVKGALQRAHDAGYQARNAELQGHAQARTPVPGGPVEAVRLEDEPKDEMEAMERIMARNGTV